MDEQRLQYLHSMGIPVWVTRQARAEGHSETTAAARSAQGSARVPTRLRLGPGSGAGLCICAAPDEPGSRLAADVARVLPRAAVWGWPVDDEDASEAAELIGEGGYESVLIFGAPLATTLFGGRVPSAIGTTRVVTLPGIAEMSCSGKARRECWQALRSAGMICPP